MRRELARLKSHPQRKSRVAAVNVLRHLSSPLVHPPTQATVTSEHRYTSCTACRSAAHSAIGRWNAFRPEISPMPPARLLITAVRTASARSPAPADAPPE